MNELNDASLTETLSFLYMNEKCDEKISNAIYIMISLFLVSFSERYCTSVTLYVILLLFELLILFWKYLVWLHIIFYSNLIPLSTIICS